ncbi:hypothetical protein VTO42DRAFT_8487 [Malbranchea cinnamomea]
MASNNDNNSKINNDTEAGPSGNVQEEQIAVSTSSVSADASSTQENTTLQSAAGDNKTEQTNDQPNQVAERSAQDRNPERDTSALPASSPPVTSEEQSAPAAPSNVASSATNTQQGQFSSTEESQLAPTQPTQPAQQPAPSSDLEVQQQSKSEIGESSAGPSSSASKQEPENSASVSLVITLLLTTGARHPFKIDAKYLRKRGVDVPNYDPFAMSVYTLKELIWREWRSEWESRPSSPSAIRLISFGKLLDDKAPLSESRFNRDAPNVVHMTIKPQEVMEEEDAKAKSVHGRDRETTESSPGCRCVIL